MPAGALLESFGIAGVLSAMRAASGAGSDFGCFANGPKRNSRSALMATTASTATPMSTLSRLFEGASGSGNLARS